MVDWIKHKVKRIFYGFNQFTPSSPLKIIDVMGNIENKDTKIRYQVSGKSTIAEDTVKNLLHDLIQLQGFSKENSKLIFSIFIKELQAPDFAIRGIVFSKQQEQFEIEDIQNNSIMTLTAEQIFESENLLKKFSTEDIKILLYSSINQHKNSGSLSKTEKSIKNNGNNLYVINN